MRRCVVGATIVAALVGPFAFQRSAAQATSTPSISVGDVTSTEGDAGTAAIRVPVSLSEPSATTIKVPYSLQQAADGSSDASDATMKSATLTFAPGVVSKYVTVTTFGDLTVEPDQHFLVTLGTPLGVATIEKGTGLVTITDDDSDNPNAGYEVSIGDITITEGDAGSRVGYLPVTLSRPPTVAVKVKFAMGCGALAVMQGFTQSFSGTLTFGIGHRTAYITFVVPGDRNVDALNRLKDYITSTRAYVFADAGTVTVVDDDGALPTNTGFAVPNFVPEALPGPSATTYGSVGTPDPITVGYDGSPAYFPGPSDARGAATGPSISGDGRFVVFESWASNLVPGDTNGINDIFIRDRLLGTTERVVKNDGTQIMPSDIPMPAGTGVTFRGLGISADGSTVVFRTPAILDPADNNPGTSWLTHNSVYSYDRNTHTLALLSVDGSGNSLPGAGAPTVSANGRYVAFAIAPDDGVGAGQFSTAGPTALGYWVRDRVRNTSTRVLEDNNISPILSAPEISANGRYLAAPTTRANCTDAELDVVDLANGNTERIDVNNDGGGATGNPGVLDGFVPSISADGRFVGFQSSQANLAQIQTPPFSIPIAYYVRDRALHSTTFYDNVWRDTRISDDGRYLALAGWTNSRQLDTVTNTTTHFGAPTVMPDGWEKETRPMSGDGTYVTYTATDLNLYAERLR